MDNNSLCCLSASELESTEAVCSSSSSSSASLGDHNAHDKVSTSLSNELRMSVENRTDAIDDLRKFPVEGCYIEEEDEEDEDDDDLSEEALLSQMGYSRSEPKRFEEEEEDISDESFLAQMGYLKNEPPNHEPVTTPTAYLNLVSAFKGSREKEGKPREECRVSWSPEVYDPPCTSDDHYTQNKTERHRSEQKAKGIAGKSRQKSGGKGVAIDGGGKGSRGGGSKASAGGGKAPGKSKDKKQADKKTKKHGSKYSAHGEI